MKVSLLLHNIRDKKLTVIVTETVILLLMAVGFIISSNSRQVISDDLSLFNSNFAQIELEDNSFCWDESSLTVDGEPDVLSGPYVSLKRGNYRVLIEYECDYQQVCTFYDSRFENKEFLDTNPIFLTPGDNNIVIHTRVGKNIDNFTVNFRYNGKGSVAIKRVAIEKDSVGWSKGLVILALLFIVFDWIVWDSDWIRKNKNTILSIIGITLVASIPLTLHGLLFGDDIPNHTMRIDSIARELVNGHFPIKMYSLFLDGHGYPEGVFYGSWLLYPAVLLRLAGFSVTTAFKSYILYINLATAIVSYQCFSRIVKDKNIGLIMSFLYTCSIWRLNVIYASSAVGQYSSLLFIPIIIYAVYELYRVDDADWSYYRRDAVILALGMTGLYTTHIIMTELTCLMLLICVVILIRKTVRLYRIKAFAFAGCISAVMGLWFVVPFADMYISTSMNVKDAVHQVSTIQHEGLAINDLLAFSGRHMNATVGMVDALSYSTPGIVLMITLIVATVLIFYRKHNVTILLLLGMSYLSLWLSTDLFPYDYLAATSRIGRLLAMVWFPVRHVGIAVGLLSVLFGLLISMLKKKNEHYYRVVGIVCVVVTLLSVFNCYGNIDEGDRVTWQNTYELNNTAAVDEYMPATVNQELFNNKAVGEGVDGTFVKRMGSDVIWNIKSEKGGHIDLPIINYKGYSVVDESGNQLSITSGENGMLRVNLAGEYYGNLLVRYIEPWYWRVAEILSLLGIISLLCIGKRLFKTSN